MNAKRYVGRLLDPIGKPIAGALVSVVRGSAPTPDIAARSTEDGKFAIGLPEGTFTIAVHLGEQVLTQISIDTASLAAEFELQVTGGGQSRIS